MPDFIVSLYPWIKTLHIFAVVSWMAGMLYLPRLYVYHADATPGSETAQTFKTMEARLYKIIMTPAMLATWFFGIVLLGIPGLVDFGAGYIWVKIALVLALSGFHGFLGVQRRKFAADANQRTAKFYRLVNELPALALILIIVMIVVRPF